MIDKLSLCKHCGCMTKTIFKSGHFSNNTISTLKVCGKCGRLKR